MAITEGPTIQFNATSGSDTQASGAGPSTAIYGTGASLDSTTSIDLSSDTPDLSGVALDGSAVLWVDSSSGRQYSQISAVDNATDIVTVVTTYGVTETGRTWGIGGLRLGGDQSATFLNDDEIWGDVLPTWSVDLLTSATDYLLDGQISPSVSGSNTLGGIKYFSSSATRPVLETTSTGHNRIFKGNVAHTTYENLHIKIGGYTGNSAGIDNRSSHYTIRNCEIEGIATNAYGPTAINGPGGNGARNVVIEGCYIHGTLNGIKGQQTGSNNGLTVANCYITDVVDIGIRCGRLDHVLIQGNTIVNCGQGVVDSSGTGGSNFQVIGNTIANCTGNGISMLATKGLSQARIYNNIITGNAYGISYTGTGWTPENRALIHDNCFGTGTGHGGANASGQTTTNIAGLNQGALAVDPGFTDSAAGDWSIDTTLKGLGYPDAILGFPTRSFVDIGANQREESGGGGSGGGTGMVGFGGGMVG